MEDKIPKQNNLSETDIQFINHSLSQRKGYPVKGKVVCLEDDKFGVDDFPENKEDIPYHLAIALDDEISLAWYSKLTRERRSDFLKNCLRITLDAFERGIINKTKAAYFAGTIKYKTAQQERLHEYKERHYKHTTLFGYDYKSYKNKHI
jgi:hypothetical protein